MLIAQITDIHIGFEPDNPAEFNRKRLDQVLHVLAHMTPRPDILLATGDLVDRGDEASYRRLKSALSQVPFPVYSCVGNHDLRANFSKQFPEVSCDADGFVQYEIVADPLRLLVIDTLEEGRHGGAFCEKRAAWLSAKLVEKPDQPTVIVMHHPPIEVGIEWLTTHANEPWVKRFAACIAGHKQIVSILCGHIHRNISAQWNSKTVVVCASTAPQVALELSPIDAEAPDGRPMIVADPPSYALHYWNGAELVTHFENADEHVMLARYDEKMQGLVREMMSERAK